MSKSHKFSIISEIKTPESMYPYEFVISWWHSSWYFGKAFHRIKKRKLFTGYFIEGHIEVLIPLPETTNIDNVKLSTNLNNI